MTHVSIIIPAFNRLGPLRQTLRSAADALLRLGGNPGEILLVDDGSTPALAGQLAAENFGWPITHLRQANQGSIVARQTGLLAARGEWILFLDSDDLIPTDKFIRQLEPAVSDNSDVVYGDMARARINEATNEIHYEPAETLSRTKDPAEFFLCVQPAPHNPVYRRSYLLSLLSTPLVPPERRYDAAGDAWLYYNLCTSPARIAKVDAPLAAAGVHVELRYSHHWEKLGLAALGIMEQFIRRCPDDDRTRHARVLVGERAFLTWRGLPRRFDSGFSRRMLSLWQRSPRGPLARLGLPGFQKLSRLLGPELAGRLLRLRNPSYDHVRTLDATQYAALFKAADRP